TTKRDAARHIHLQQHGVQDFATDVLKIDVDALGAGCLELLGEAARLVVDAAIEAQLLGHIAALRGPAGDADGAAAFDLGDLTHQRTNGAGGCRHDDRLAWFRLTDVEETEVGGPSRHAEPTDPTLERRLVRIDLDHALAVGDGVPLDAEHALHGIADLERGVVRLLDNASGPSAHDLAELHPGDIGPSLVHPARHRRIERNVRDPDAHLAGAGLGQRTILNGEIGARHHASWAAGELDQAVAHWSPQSFVSNLSGGSHVLGTASRALHPARQLSEHPTSRHLTGGSAAGRTVWHWGPLCMVPLSPAEPTRP